MLLRESLRNPYDGDSVQPCGIGQQLPEMRMIGALQLIFDQHPVVRGCVFAQDVRAERPNILLLRLKFQFDANGFTEQFQIFLLRQPRSKVYGLRCPRIA